MESTGQRTGNPGEQTIIRKFILVLHDVFIYFLALVKSCVSHVLIGVSLPMRLCLECLEPIIPGSVEIQSTPLNFFPEILDVFRFICLPLAIVQFMGHLTF